ncbi:trans-sialidase [Trypanosoma cruzi]|nr:trans-sialidase [Trypanosoma cruzi]
MLSRVAAVKAPRTHNRRRVTGSSGRRREGRESEPQRPNMSRRVFASAVLLLLVMMCCGSGRAAAADGIKQGIPLIHLRGRRRYHLLIGRSLRTAAKSPRSVFLASLKWVMMYLPLLKRSARRRTDPAAVLGLSQST